MNRSRLAHRSSTVSRAETADGIRRVADEACPALSYIEAWITPPRESEWFADIDNPGTRRMYRAAIGEFMSFTGIAEAAQFRDVGRSHVIAWRKTLLRRQLAGLTIRAKLAALSSLFEYL